MINICNELKKFSMYPPIHSKWDLVGYIGSSPVLENAVQRWGWPIGPKCTSKPVKSPYGHACQKFKNIHRAIYIPNFALK